MVARMLVLLQTFLAIETVTEVAAVNHRCYVCVPNSGSSISDVLQMYPEGTVIPLCNRFATDAPDFVRECPSPSYQGCLTQTNGSHVTKTCTDVEIEDCKTANKIKYCYCKGDLCNGEAVPAEAPAPPEVSADDDEDSPSEGSGSLETSDTSGPLETSSETDLEVVRKLLPTTTKSLVLTTPPPRNPTKAAAAGPSAPPLPLTWALSSLPLLRALSHRSHLQL